MKIFELAKKLGRSTEEIIRAADYLDILVKTKSSILSDEEVKQIIKYFRKRRLLFFFKRYFSVFLLIILLTILFFIITPQNATSGEIYASVDEQGEVSVEWKFEDTVEEGVILMESESLVVFIEVDENNGETVECCFDEDLTILLLIIDDEELIEVNSLDLSLSNTSISSTTLPLTTTLPPTTTTSTITSTTTTTTLPDCNDEDFKPYTLYDSDGNANTVMSCRNEQDALDSGYIYLTNPKPENDPTTTTLVPTTTTSTTTTTLVPTTTTSTTLPINELAEGDQFIESSQCLEFVEDKYKFVYQAIIKSDDKMYQYRFGYRVRTYNKIWSSFRWSKGWKTPNSSKDTEFRATKKFNKQKGQVIKFQYQFKYRPRKSKNPNDVVTTPKVFWNENIPCTLMGVPNTTTTTVDDKQVQLKLTDDIAARTPATITTPTTTISTTTISTTPTTTLAPTTTTLAPTTTTSTTTTTTTTLPECNDKDFKPYTLYDSDGNANTVMSCRNEQDALTSGFEFTVNPKPPPSTTTTTSATTTTSTTTTTIPDPSSSISQSLSSCSGPSGTRTSTLSLTNNESYTAYYLIEYSTNSGSSYSTAQTNLSISGGATNTANSVVVSDGSSIIWRFKDSRTSNDFSNASYEILSVVTVDCPDGYYVNVDGSNTYALSLECRNWNTNTRARFRANPWWGSEATASDYMFALIALTGNYDNGDTSVDVTDYFDYSSSIPGGNCSGFQDAAYFVYQRNSGDFYAPEWNDTEDEVFWSSSDREYVIFAELVP